MKGACGRDRSWIQSSWVPIQYHIYKVILSGSRRSRNPCLNPGHFAQRSRWFQWEFCIRLAIFDSTGEIILWDFFQNKNQEVWGNAWRNTWTSESKYEPDFSRLSEHPSLQTVVTFLRISSIILVYEGDTVALFDTEEIKFRWNSLSPYLSLYFHQTCS